jgi:hypothetical protein
VSALEVFVPECPPRCPKCGGPPRFVEVTARVRCEVDLLTGRLGRTDHVGKRVGPITFICGGGHAWSPPEEEVGGQG